MFKVGSGVICVSNILIEGWDFRSLTIDKLYLIIDINSNYIKVFDDNGDFSSYPSKCFEDVVTYRNRIIDNILT